MTFHEMPDSISLVPTLLTENTRFVDLFFFNCP
jgi:hypothetical protein